MVLHGVPCVVPNERAKIDIKNYQISLRSLHSRFQCKTMEIKIFARQVVNFLSVSLQTLLHDVPFRYKTQADFRTVCTNCIGTTSLKNIYNVYLQSVL